MGLSPEESALVKQMVSKLQAECTLRDQRQAFPGLQWICWSISLLLATLLIKTPLVEAWISHLHSFHSGQQRHLHFQGMQVIPSQRSYRSLSLSNLLQAAALSFNCKSDLSSQGALGIRLCYGKETKEITVWDHYAPDSCSSGSYESSEDWIPFPNHLILKWH